MSRNPEAVLDTNTDQWCVELRCGNFTYLGQPPFDVEWTTPSGDRRSSSSYRNGQFKLLVKAEGLEEGSYHCRVPLSASSAFCLASGTSTGNDTITSLAVDSLDVRLMVLEAQQKVLQKESQELKEENAKLKQANVYTSAVKSALTATVKDVINGINSRLNLFAQRLHLVEERPTSSTSGKVSFHARHVTMYQPQTGSPVIFTDVLVNHGNAYDSTTGTFTAPFNGTYFVVATAAPQDTVNHMSLFMVVDDADASAGFGCGTGCESGVSVHALVDLVQGVQAWVRIEGHLLLNQGTTFSGFLLSPYL